MISDTDSKTDCYLSLNRINMNIVTSTYSSINVSFIIICFLLLSRNLKINLYARKDMKSISYTLERLGHQNMESSLEGGKTDNKETSSEAVLITQERYAENLD